MTALARPTNLKLTRSYARRVTLSSVALAAVALSGCVVAPAHRVYPAPAPGPVVYQQPAPVVTTPAPVTVYDAPPAPQQEVYGVAPGPGYFWVNGVWLWEGNRHVWRPGHWEMQRPGRVYVPHVWVRVGRGWQIQGGHWR